jgi:hypothetical protein
MQSVQTPKPVTTADAGQSTPTTTVKTAEN